MNTVKDELQVLYRQDNISAKFREISSKIL